MAPNLFLLATLFSVCCNLDQYSATKDMTTRKEINHFTTEILKENRTIPQSSTLSKEYDKQRTPQESSVISSTTQTTNEALDLTPVYANSTFGSRFVRSGLQLLGAEVVVNKEVNASGRFRVGRIDINLSNGITTAGNIESDVSGGGFVRGNKRRDCDNCDGGRDGEGRRGRVVSGERLIQFKIMFICSKCITFNQETQIKWQVKQ